MFWQLISLFLGAVERSLVWLPVEYKFLSQIFSWIIEVKGDLSAFNVLKYGIHALAHLLAEM